MDTTYEMLWDCEYCGQKKLLAKTHRYCPSCGGMQKAEWRYFPSDQDKVAVADHVYVGADRICPACQAPSSAAAQHCGGCGAPLEGAKQAAQRADQEGKSFAAETVQDAKNEQARAKAEAGGAGTPKGTLAKKRPNLKRDLIILGSFFLVLIGFFLAIGWTRATHVRVAGHSWKHEIKIENYSPVQDKSWCDSMPSDAHQVRREREVRSQRQVPNGEECSTVRHDNGDGTFRESQRCRPRYKSEPVYDDRCYYTVNRWHYSRSLTTQGDTQADTRPWTEVKLNGTGQCLGCEREGQRVAEYVVHLRLVDVDKQRDCSVPEARWLQFKPGSEWVADIGRLTSYFNCDSLRPAK